MLDYISDIIADGISELDVIKSIEAEEHGLKARVKDAIEIGEHVL